MISQNERIEYFGEFINKTADKQVRKHEEKAKELLEREINSIETELSLKLESRLKFETERILAASNKELSALENDEKLRIAQKRDEIRDNVMDAVAEKLKAFVSGSGYEDFLRRQLESLSAELGECIIFCREADEPLVLRLSSENPLVLAVKPSDEIVLGGLFARSKDSEKAAYDTLDRRLEKCREDFLSIIPLK